LGVQVGDQKSEKKKKKNGVRLDRKARIWDQKVSVRKRRCERKLGKRKQLGKRWGLGPKVTNLMEPHPACQHQIGCRRGG